MEKTTAYVVYQYGHSAFSGQRESKGVFYSKDEAEFYVSQLENEERERVGTREFVWSYNYFTFEEVTTRTIDRNSKAYKKFAREMIEKINRKIDENDTKCSGAMEENERLIKERGYYQSQIA